MDVTQNVSNKTNVKSVQCGRLLKSSTFVLQKDKAPKNGVELCQSSSSAIIGIGSFYFRLTPTRYNLQHILYNTGTRVSPASRACESLWGHLRSNKENNEGYLLSTITHCVVSTGQCPVQHI